MTGTAARLRIALLEVYRPYVLAKVKELAEDAPDDLDGAINAGHQWLESTLGDLLERPFDQQNRGPLELFQEALRFPTEVLLGDGHQPVTRDVMVARALPGDVFDLAPASTQQLGEEVWEAHLAWGYAKAQAMAGDLKDTETDVAT